MITYAYELGHQPHISHAEILSVLKLHSISYTSITRNNDFFIIETPSPIDASLLMRTLGGTIRIARKIESREHDLATLIHHLEHATDGKIQFSLSGSFPSKFALQLKKELKSRGRSVRYIEAKNTATIIHNNLIEKKGDILKIGSDWFVTEAVQDIANFSSRDFDRPRADTKSGMLPPKLARMMINLAEVPSDAHLLDPFCGSGTVLIEALSLGYSHVSGSDTSEKAVEDSTANIGWFRKEHPECKAHTAVHLGSATTLSKIFKPSSVDAIISEPYMGSPLRGHESRLALETQAQELKTLFIDSFTSFHTILSPHAVVIFIIPIFRHGTDWIRTLAHNEIEKRGFSIVPFSPDHHSLLYSRADQFVGREIWKFKKN